MTLTLTKTEAEAEAEGKTETETETEMDRETETLTKKEAEEYFLAVHRLIENVIIIAEETEGEFAGARKGNLVFRDSIASVNGESFAPHFPEIRLQFD